MQALSESSRSGGLTLNLIDNRGHVLLSLIIATSTELLHNFDVT